MRYKTIQDLVAKYGLRFGLDEQTPLADWEKNLAALLKEKEKAQQNAKAPNLRHVADREFEETRDALSLIRQQRLYGKLRDYLKDDQQELFEYEWKEGQQLLPREHEDGFTEVLKLKSDAKKKWADVFSVPAAAVTAPVPVAEAKAQESQPSKSAMADVTSAIPSRSTAPAEIMASSPAVPGSTTIQSGAIPPPVLPVTATAATDTKVADPVPKPPVSKPAAESSSQSQQAAALQVRAEAAAEPAAAILSKVTETANQQSMTPPPVIPRKDEAKADAPAAAAALVPAQDKVVNRLEQTHSALKVVGQLKTIAGIGAGVSTWKILGGALAAFLLALTALINRQLHVHEEKEKTLDGLNNAMSQADGAKRRNAGFEEISNAYYQVLTQAEKIGPAAKDQLARAREELSLIEKEGRARLASVNNWLDLARQAQRSNDLAGASNYYHKVLTDSQGLGAVAYPLVYEATNGLGQMDAQGKAAQGLTDRLHAITNLLQSAGKAWSRGDLLTAKRLFNEARLSARTNDSSGHLDDVALTSLNQIEQQEAKQRASSH